MSSFCVLPILGELFMSIQLGGGLFPFDLQLLERSLEILFDVLVRIGSGYSSRDLEFPALTTLIAIHPVRLSQWRLLAVLINSVDPQTDAQRILNLHGLNGHALLTTLDTSFILRAYRLDAPVGPRVARHSRVAWVLIVQLNTSLDPFAGSTRGGGLGECKEETSLVVLVNVGCAEGNCCGDEVL